MAIYSDRDRDKEEDDGKENKAGNSRIQRKVRGRYNGCQKGKDNM